MTVKFLGYKLRKHIGKALVARSEAIRMAVKNYNIAATSLSPPRFPLDAKTVLEYVFIAEFDLLRDSRQQLHLQAWAQPAECSLASSYFKLECSKEKIVRVNIEARRLRTAMHDGE